MAVLGGRVWDAQGDDDTEWRSTLPAPAWVLHTAKLAEVALWNPMGWLMIFPFFTGLGLQAGLGLMAPLLALGVSLPFFFSYAVLGGVLDLVGRGGSRLLHVVRFVAPALALLLFVGWMGTAGLEKLHVDLLGQWLDFSEGLAWLPFCEPARALLSWRRAPLHALGWLGVFAVEMSVLLGVGLLLLRKAYFAELVQGSSSRRGTGAAADARASAAQPRRPLGGLLGAVVVKELLCLRRKPSLSALLLTRVVVTNGLGLLLLSRLSGLDASLRPGLALFGVGLLLISMGPFLELERPALWLWAALPRTLSWVFAQKTLLAAALATLSALPVVVYALLSTPNPSAAVPALLYAAACTVVVAFFQTALWLGSVSPSVATSLVQNLVRTLKLTFVAGILANGFSSRATPETNVQLLVVVAAFAITFWHGSLDRLPHRLDPDSSQPVRLTATYSLAVIVVMRVFQWQLQNGLIGHGTPPSRAAALSFIVAGGLGLGASLFWLWVRGVPELSERLGLVRGRGWRVILREGVLWSLPAISVNLAYALLFGRRLVQSTEQVAQQPAMVTLLAGSALVAVGVACLAAPLVEEVLFRGMLYRSLRSGWGVVFSLLVSAAVFTADHSLVAAVPVFCAAVCFTMAFERSRSLFAAMLTHALYNGAIALITLGL